MQEAALWEAGEPPGHADTPDTPILEPAVARGCAWSTHTVLQGRLVSWLPRHTRAS